MKPQRRYELNKAIAQARERFLEWNKTTGWPPVNSRQYLDFIALLDDAVVCGWDAYATEAHAIIADLKKEVGLLEGEL